MEIWQPTALVGTCFLLVFFSIHLLRPFGIRKRYTLTLLFPLIMFTTGFIMRLAKKKSAVDVGYYLTEISYIFTYVIFSAAILLGQVKYWKTKHVRKLYK